MTDMSSVNICKSYLLFKHCKSAHAIVSFLSNINNMPITILWTKHIWSVNERTILVYAAALLSGGTDSILLGVFEFCMYENLEGILRALNSNALGTKNGPEP